MDSKLTIDELQKRIQSLQNENEKLKKRGAASWLNQERLSQILENISIPTFVIDNQHKVTHYNKAMETLSGIPADRVIGTNRHGLASEKFLRVVYRSRGSRDVEDVQQDQGHNEAARIERERRQDQVARSQ